MGLVMSEHGVPPAEPNPKRRYDGFTCPKCGGHNFGTHKHYARFMGNKYPDQALVGTCHESQYTAGIACDFEWARDDAAVESQVMYSWTREEWKQDRHEFLAALENGACACRALASNRTWRTP